MRNEKTSSKVSKAAGHLLSQLHKSTPNESVVVVMTRREYWALTNVCRGPIYRSIGTVGQVKAVAASSLTQSPDRSK